MNRTTRSRLNYFAVTLVVVAAAASCSSSPDEQAGPTTPPSASASAPAPSSSAPAPDSPSPTAAAPSSSAVTEPGEDEGSENKGSEDKVKASEEGASAPTLLRLGKKVGCNKSEVTPTKEGDTSGINAGVFCEVGSKTYILASVPDKSAKKAITSFAESAGASGTFYYVAGPGWLGLAVESSSKSPPTKSDATALQSKIGGTVTSSN